MKTGWVHEVAPSPVSRANSGVADERSVSDFNSKSTPSRPARRSRMMGRVRNFRKGWRGSAGSAVSERFTALEQKVGELEQVAPNDSLPARLRAAAGTGFCLIEFSGRT